MLHPDYPVKAVVIENLPYGTWEDDLAKFLNTSLPCNGARTEMYHESNIQFQSNLTTATVTITPAHDAVQILSLHGQYYECHQLVVYSIDPPTILLACNELFTPKLRPVTQLGVPFAPKLVYDHISVCKLKDICSEQCQYPSVAESHDLLFKNLPWGSWEDEVMHFVANAIGKKDIMQWVLCHMLNLTTAMITASSIEVAQMLIGLDGAIFEEHEIKVEAIVKVEAFVEAIRDFNDNVMNEGVMNEGDSFIKRQDNAFMLEDPPFPNYDSGLQLLTNEINTSTNSMIEQDLHKKTQPTKKKFDQKMWENAIHIPQSTKQKLDQKIQKCVIKSPLDTKMKSEQNIRESVIKIPQSTVRLDQISQSTEQKLNQQIHENVGKISQSTGLTLNQTIENVIKKDEWNDSKFIAPQNRTCSLSNNVSQETEDLSTDMRQRFSGILEHALLEKFAAVDAKAKSYRATKF